ncbi:MAG TPA: tetratricopeptide repeat protein [Candidatus Acidoferrales bacterium]|nr:tetratricopeptide repeat protein [Candidatus Acidoferrales bacterium]
MKSLHVQRMRAEKKHARLYLVLEIGTITLALFLYVAVYRPKEKIDAEWNQAINLGQVALDTGDFAKAQKEFQFSVEFAEKHKMGALDIASCQDSLADADRGLENYEDAVLLDERAQPVFEKYQSRWEGRYADFLVKLAASYEQLGRYGEAETAYKRALLLQEKTFGSDALPLVSTLNAMAYFYYDRDHDEIAEPLAKRSLAICQSRRGPRDPCSAWATSMLSLVYDGEGKFTDAEHLAREALSVLETSLGSQTYEVASTLNRLGLALDGQGRWREAEVAFNKALAIRQQRSGAESEDLVVILRNLSRVYSEEGRKQEAAVFRKRAEEISANHSRVSPAMPTAAQTAEWHRYTNEDGNFSVLFPTEPMQSVREQNGVVIHTIQATSGSTVYVVAYQKMKSEQAVDESTLKALTNCNLVSNSSPSPPIRGYVGFGFGIKCRVQDKNAIGIGNFYFGKHYAFSVLAMFPSAASDAITVNRFTHSFSLIDPSK